MRRRSCGAASLHKNIKTQRQKGRKQRKLLAKAINEIYHVPTLDVARSRNYLLATVLSWGGWPAGSLWYSDNIHIKVGTVNASALREKSSRSLRTRYAEYYSPAKSQNIQIISSAHRSQKVANSKER